MQQANNKPKGKRWPTVHLNTLLRAPRLTSLFCAILLFIGTVYSTGSLTQWLVRTFFLKPGVLATAGATPKFDYFRGTILQQQVFQAPDFMPLYGSSEMSMITNNHPATIFSGHPTGFSPFFIGHGGSQTLIHTLDLAAMGRATKDKKLAIFLTPQWFRPGGISESTFAGNFSALHVYEMLNNPQLTPELKQRLAQRVLQFPKALEGHPSLERLLSLEGKKDWKASLFKLLYSFPAKIDMSALQIQDAGKSVYWLLRLPAKEIRKNSGLTRGASVPQWGTLLDEAIKEAKLTATNPFYMLNSYYTTHLEDKLSEYKDADKNAKLYPSPEYDDLSLLCQILKQEGAEPIFFIIPMNGKWYDFTGFPLQERHNAYQHMAEIIHQYGFQLADLSPHEYDTFYMKDPWHLAWKGWIDVDKRLDKFYHE